MSNLSIIFQHQWWLMLLLIPAIAVALFPYFRLQKKHRRTRNRVISLVLHLLILILGISVLAGAALKYEEPNPENHMVILVDVSHSSRSTKEQKDRFVKKILDNNDSAYKIAVVTFSKTPYLAANFSYDAEALYSSYLKVTTPDEEQTEQQNDNENIKDDGTNIAEALSYARAKIENPVTGKIILLTDGLQTEGDALSMATVLSTELVKIDIVHFANDYGDEIQILNVSTPPPQSIKLDVATAIDVTLAASYANKLEIGNSKQVILKVFDNGLESGRHNLDYKSIIDAKGRIVGDVHRIYHTFTDSTIHQLKFELEIVGVTDTMTQNNVYYAYVYMQSFDNILILDQHDEGQKLFELISEGNVFTSVTRMDIAHVPMDLLELSQFDQIILVNIANRDMPEGFDQILNRYVGDLGGGLLTVGGNEHNDASRIHAYAMDDMNVVDPNDPQKVVSQSLYQKMLPVDCIDFYPPVAVVLVIDTSGSMGPGYPDIHNQTKLPIVQEAAKAAIDLLNDRDYVGIVSFDSYADTVIGLTAVPQKTPLRRAIDNLNPLGGTNYAAGINMARDLLVMFDKPVKTKRIIMLTDGAPQDTATGPWGYMTAAQKCKDNDIAISMITLLDALEGNPNVALGITELTGGNAYDVESAVEAGDALKDEITVDKIGGLIKDIMRPAVGTPTWLLDGIEDSEIPMINGYYGVRAKETSTVVLKADFNPIYAQWNYGKGKVGSFMSDLSGKAGSFTEKIMNGEEPKGRQLVLNMIRVLLPERNIAMGDSFTIKQDNAVAKIEITSTMTSGQYFNVTMTDITKDRAEDYSKTEEVKTATSGNTLKVSFVYPTTGIFEFTFQKKDGNGDIGEPQKLQSTFSYTQEYNIVFDEENAVIGTKLLAAMSTVGKGQIHYVPFTMKGQEKDPEEIKAENEFIGKINSDVVKVLPVIVDKEIWIAFVTAILVMFLLDIAVRKFKFKWPWEIVRDRKERKRLGAH